MTGAALPKNKREILSELVLSKREKATTMNEFYNIPSLDGMPQFLLFLLMTGMHFLKIKRLKVSKCYQR